MLFKHNLVSIDTATRICFKRIVSILILSIVATRATAGGIGHPAQEKTLANSSRRATTTGTVQGLVRDSNGKPVANATLILKRTQTDRVDATTPVVKSDSVGGFRFAMLREGLFSLQARLAGYKDSNIYSVSVTAEATTTVDVVLTLETPSAIAAIEQSNKEISASGSPPPQYFDEPEFTVAGVTQATNSGGHGSDTAIRTSEALAKATVSLSKYPANNSGGVSRKDRAVEQEKSLRKLLNGEPNSFDANRDLGTLLAESGNSAEALPYLQRASQTKPDDADVHVLLAEVAEKVNDPLLAVREYQRAAELQPSERNFFELGAELLAHRALQPATEIFAKGSRLFPRSNRLLVGLGVSWYGRGAYDQAATNLESASDLDPANSIPYLFLGKMQSVEVEPFKGAVTTLARFAKLEPDNALANFYYAVSILKESADERRSGTAAGDSSKRVELLLHKALQIDPQLGAAHLLLGNMAWDGGDVKAAIDQYRQAIEVSSDMDDTIAEAHYRLAQAYLHTGEKLKAQEELELHRQLVTKIQEGGLRELRDVQQFVITLRSDTKNLAPQQ
jgi:tetratricopeptide (TPR) repeat protein